MNSITDQTGNNSVDIFGKRSINENNDKDIYYLQNQVKKLQKLLLGEQGLFWFFRSTIMVTKLILFFQINSQNYKNAYKTQRLSD